jgi:hypothetical protein
MISDWWDQVGPRARTAKCLAAVFQNMASDLTGRWNREQLVIGFRSSHLIK